jgi:hypothetical protein
MFGLSPFRFSTLKLTNRESWGTLGIKSKRGDPMKIKDRPFGGKIAWVTGSSRGIGRVIAAHMASLGASVAVHGTGPFLPCF